MNTLQITLPLPPKELSPNGRYHWAAKAKKTRNYREKAGLEAKIWLGGEKPRHGAATVRIQWFSKTARRIDLDNCLAWIKAAFDGVTDSGFLSDDRGLTHLPVELSKDASNPRVVLTFGANESSPATGGKPHNNEGIK